MGQSDGTVALHYTTTFIQSQDELSVLPKDTPTPGTTNPPVLVLFKYGLVLVQT